MDLRDQRALTKLAIWMVLPSAKVKSVTGSQQVTSACKGLLNGIDDAQVISLIGYGD